MVVIDIIWEGILRAICDILKILGVWCDEEN